MHMIVPNLLSDSFCQTQYSGGEGLPSINNLSRKTENWLSPITLQNSQLEAFLVYVTSYYYGNMCKFSTEKNTFMEGAGLLLLARPSHKQRGCKYTPLS